MLNTIRNTKSNSIHRTLFLFTNQHLTFCSLLDEVVEEYGLKCVRFSLAGLDIDISKYDAIDESQIAAISAGNISRGQAIAKENLARGDKAAIDVLGEDWGRQQAANILGDLARNPGAGGVGAMGAGMGMGMAAGSVFGNMANQMFAPMGQQQAQPVQQPMQQSAQPVSSGRFAPKGQPVQQAAPQAAPQAAAEDPFETLSKLKRMLDAGLISQQQYDAKVAES